MDIRLVASLGLGVATNLDNFGIGSAYGINRIRIGHWPNILIATFNSGATGISMLCGVMIAKILSKTIANATGAVIIGLLGIYYLYDTYFGSSSKMNNESLGIIPSIPAIMNYVGLRCHVRGVNAKEVFALAIGLSISNLTMGVGAGLAGFDVRVLVVVMFAFSWIMIVLGDLFGRITSVVLPDKWASTVSGLLLIAIAIRGLFF